MNLRDLCVLLNVSQVQILRILETKTAPTEYQLKHWLSEMRKAELHMRGKEVLLP